MTRENRKSKVESRKSEVESGGQAGSANGQPGRGAADTPPDSRLSTFDSRICIFHTADLHGRLSAAAAERLASLKQSHPGSLLLDAGDALRAGNLSFHSGGGAVLRLMAEAGYDVLAMGNRESHPLRSGLVRKLQEATFPVLSANLAVVRGGPPPTPVRPWVVCECGGRRIAVFGLTPQMTRPESLWAKVTDFVWEEPVATARRVASDLKRRADLVICLSHCGSHIDRLLSEIPEIDVVLGGHDHRAFVEHRPGQAALVHPGRFGSHVSHTTVAGRDDVSSELIELEKGPCARNGNR